MAHGTGSGANSPSDSIPLSPELAERLLAAACQVYMDVCLQHGTASPQVVQALAHRVAPEAHPRVELALRAMRQALQAQRHLVVDEDLLAGALLLIVHLHLLRISEDQPSSELARAFSVVIERLGVHRAQVWLVALKLAIQIARTEAHDSLASLRALRDTLRRF